MTEHYLCVPPGSLKQGDRIVECQAQVLGPHQTQRTLHLCELNVTVHSHHWDKAPVGDYNLIKVLTYHNDGSEEYLFLRAHSKVWIMREKQ
jgi:aminoglycoside N3'-acetyltransferase